jgi:hypothetical protein
MIFGGLWAYVAALGSPSAWRSPLSLAVALATLLLVARLWYRGAPAETNRRRFNAKWYLAAVALECLAIYAASLLLPRVGLQSYFLQVVGIIVGLHFLGLWSATGSAHFVRIAVGMCVISAAAMLFPETLHLFRVRDVVTGLGNALVLWLGASATAPRAGWGNPGG